MVTLTNSDTNFVLFKTELSIKIISYKCKKCSADKCEMLQRCRAMMTKGMVFRYTWVYSKEDTMAHTLRLVVTS